MDFNINPEITYFAKTNYRDTNHTFGIKKIDRRQHMYVVGKSGVGKSGFLSNMILQDALRGEGFCVVDPHGELVEDALQIIPRHRIHEVVYFNPADPEHHIGFNVLEVTDGRYKHLVASGLMGIFTKIWANVWSSRMEYILNNSILALLDTPGSTLLGIPRLLVDNVYRKHVVENIVDPVVKSFWVHEYESWQDKFRNEAIAPIQNKVGQFLSSAIVRNIVGQPRSTINIFDLMNEGKILLVNVSKGRIGEDNSALIGAMLITKLQLAAMERVTISEDKRRDFYLYVDEFQNFVTDSFASILSEARKYRLCLIIAHQYIAQLENDSSTVVRDAVFGNVGSMVSFRISAGDAEFLETEFSPEFSPEDFVILPNFKVYMKLMIDGMTSRPFSADTLRPATKDLKDQNIAKEVEESSRRLYMRPRADVESIIERWSASPTGTVDMEEFLQRNESDVSRAKLQETDQQSKIVKETTVAGGENTSHQHNELQHEPEALSAKNPEADILQSIGLAFPTAGQKATKDLRKLFRYKTRRRPPYVKNGKTIDRPSRLSSSQRKNDIKNAKHGTSAFSTEQSDINQNQVNKAVDDEFNRLIAGTVQHKQAQKRPRKHAKKKVGIDEAQKKPLDKEYKTEVVKKPVSRPVTQKTEQPRNNEQTTGKTRKAGNEKYSSLKDTIAKAMAARSARKKDLDQSSTRTPQTETIIKQRQPEIEAQHQAPQENQQSQKLLPKAAEVSEDTLRKILEE